MNKFFDSKLFYKLLALIITILLTVYVSYNQVGFIPRGQRTRTLQTVTKTETLKLPLQISVNTDKYYVTGYPEKVKVNITAVSYTHLTLPTISCRCRSRWSPYH